ERSAKAATVRSADQRWFTGRCRVGGRCAVPGCGRRAGLDAGSYRAVGGPPESRGGSALMRGDSGDYRAIFLSDLPLMDVRAPVEFHKGAFPQVLNLPLMNDDERQRVGTCFKQRGQQAAIELGHQLVSGALKAERIAAWAAFAKGHPDGYLYCARGGLRSQIAQQWLSSEAGIEYPRVLGGYKALRGFLIQTIDEAVAECELILLGGLTGTGKTELL